MTMAVVAFCSAILLFAAGFHLYWGLGGHIGVGVSLPQREDGSTAVKATAFGATIVGLILALVLLLVLGLVGGIHLPVPQEWLKAAVLFWAVVFSARALSWSRYVGLFKKVRTTRFASYDTLLFSPLCLVLGMGFFYLGLTDHLQ